MTRRPWWKHAHVVDPDYKFWHVKVQRFENGEEYRASVYVYSDNEEFAKRYTEDYYKTVRGEDVTVLEVRGVHSCAYEDTLNFKRKNPEEFERIQTKKYAEGGYNW